MRITRFLGWRSYTLSAACGLLLAGAWLVPVTPASANTTTHNCANIAHNTVGADGALTSSDSGIDGVEGTVYVPTTSAAWINGQFASLADVYFFGDDYVSHYYQLGWFIAHNDGAGGLPDTYTPHAVFIEGDDVDGELTPTDLGPLTQNSWYDFKIQRDPGTWGSTNHYQAFINGGSPVHHSVTSANVKGRPGFIGESTYDCPMMYGLASNSGYGPTLSAHHSGGSWSLWQQHINRLGGTAATDTTCWSDSRLAGQTATVLAESNC